MNLGTSGKALIQSFEQCRLHAYLDGGGVLTIGWGHTGTDVYDGQTISQEEADALFVADVAEAEDGVNRLVTVPLTQNQFDALVSFAFNVGTDIDEDTKAEGLGDSTLLRKLNSSDYIGAADEFMKWNKDNGVVVKGLTRRRRAERDLFLTEDA